MKKESYKSREILFRGKCIDGNRWAYGYMIKSNEGRCSIYCDYSIIGSDKQVIKVCVKGYEVIPETVGQFTGLTDKNGIKIFEGDLVNIKNKPYQIVNPCIVVWGKKSHGWSLRCVIEGSQWIKIKYYSLPASANIEVVGNIYKIYD